jgi:glycosyltransferase involved in cell wall biosynthesis
MRVLFFGTYDAQRHQRVTVLQEGFASLGDEVVECKVPLKIDTSLRVRMLGRPHLLPLLVARIAGTWLRLLWRSNWVGPIDALVVGYLGHFDVHLARLRWPDIPIVLDHLVFAKECAIDRGVSTGWVLRSLERLDQEAVAVADVVLVDTEEHASLLPTMVRERALVVPIGAPAAWFQEPPTAASCPLRVVFFGLYTPLQGTPIIGEALALLADEPGVRVTMVGSGQELRAAQQAAADNPAVRWLEWVSLEDLPGLVAGHDICLGIFGIGAKAFRVVPHKVVQGAAAGCVIVTSDTPPQRAALDDAAVYVPAGDGRALAAALRMLAREPELLHVARRHASRRAAERFHGKVVVERLRERLLSSTHAAAVRGPDKAQQFKSADRTGP